MALFTPADLAEMRRMNDANLPARATVVRTDGSVTDAAGNATAFPRIVGANRPCRFGAAMAPTTAAVGQQDMERDARLLVFAANEDVRAGDRVTVAGTTAGIAWMVALDVLGLEGPSQAAVMTRVRCRLADVQPDQA